jgi:hypothetical protein
MTLGRGRFVSHRAEFMARLHAQIGEALDDVAAIAQANKGSPADTRVERSGPDGGRIGSSRSYAKAQNVGAYIVPKRARALKFADGSFRMRARIPATRWLNKAVRFWGERLAHRLRQV